MIEVNQYTIATIGEMVEAVLADYEEKLEAQISITQEHKEALLAFAVKLEVCYKDLAMLLEANPL